MTVYCSGGFLLEGETGGIHSVVISFFVVLKMDSVLRNYFLGKGFAKTETNLFWRKFGLGFRAEEGFGEKSARVSEFFFVGRT